LCFLQSSIGSFSVVLCSDFREFDVLAAIEGQAFLDYVIVYCCNPYADLWKHLAVADAVRLHSFVIVSNWSGDADDNGHGKGSVCVSPTRKIDSLNDQPVVRTVALAKGNQTFTGSLLLSAVSQNQPRRVE
jgi:predicted amidohydrolase